MPYTVTLTDLLVILAEANPANGGTGEVNTDNLVLKLRLALRSCDAETLATINASAAAANAAELARHEAAHESYDDWCDACGE